MSQPTQGLGNKAYQGLASEHVVLQRYGMIMTFADLWFEAIRRESHTFSAFAIGRRFKRSAEVAAASSALAQREAGGCSTVGPYGGGSSRRSVSQTLPHRILLVFGGPL